MRIRRAVSTKEMKLNQALKLCYESDPPQSFWRLLVPSGTTLDPRDQHRNHRVQAKGDGGP